MIRGSARELPLSRNPFRPTSIEKREGRTVGVREVFVPHDYMPFPFDGRGLVMALALDAFFDESERNRDGTEPLSVAGYVFKPTKYRSFCRAWRRMLAAGPSP